MVGEVIGGTIVVFQLRDVGMNGCPMILLLGREIECVAEVTAQASVKHSSIGSTMTLSIFGSWPSLVGRYQTLIVDTALVLRGCQVGMWVCSFYARRKEAHFMIDM